MLRMKVFAYLGARLFSLRNVGPPLLLVLCQVEEQARFIAHTALSTLNFET